MRMKRLRGAREVRHGQERKQLNTILQRPARIKCGITASERNSAQIRFFHSLRKCAEVLAFVSNKFYLATPPNNAKGHVE